MILYAFFETRYLV